MIKKIVLLVGELVQNQIQEEISIMNYKHVTYNLLIIKNLKYLNQHIDNQKLLCLQF